MKVVLLNGSPHKNGCTFTALSEVEKMLNAEGIETEMLQLGTEPVAGCRGCGACHKTGKCVIDDLVNPYREKMLAADGIVVGAPVHYASACGAICSFMDRAFFSGAGFAGKPAAAVVSCRRGGASAAFDRLNKYFTISSMPVVASTYWNSVHGNSPEEVRRDEEGLQVMRNLGRNMAWMLKCIEAGKKEGIAFPEQERQYFTNFIR